MACSQVYKRERCLVGQRVQLLPGEECILCHLVDTPQYNGKLGKLLTILPDNLGCYQVEVCDKVVRDTNHSGIKSTFTKTVSPRRGV